ncbi:MAG: metal-dependent hydrolase [Ectothiorhodospiraceae bacterium]|nr:metal-dependent hydrolase [Ectothiorhodospiraceae bacterium]
MTHAISGAVLARATAPKRRAGTLSLKERTWVGGLAAAAPDLDFVVRLFGSDVYLEQHRGVTHSLVAMPVWAFILAVGFSVLGGRRYGWKAYYGVTLLALFIHILGDLITSYGTQILAPFSSWAPGFNTTFIIDPWFSAILVVGLLVSLYWRPRLAASLSLAALTALVLFQHTQYRAALDVAQRFADERGMSAARVEAYPQPFSAFNWLLTVSHNDAHYLARVNLRRSDPPRRVPEDAAWFRRIWASYQPVDQAQWRRHAVYGEGDRDALARSAWAQDGFGFYRRFAHLPSLYRVDRASSDVCVWFKDLRFQLEGLPPPFRYGVCRDGDRDGWRVFTLGMDGEPSAVGGLLW